MVAGVKPYKCPSCDKSFTQRCSLESHTKKVHGQQLPYGYKQRRTKVQQTSAIIFFSIKISSLFIFCRLFVPEYILKSRKIFRLINKF